MSSKYKNNISYDKRDYSTITDDIFTNKEDMEDEEDIEDIEKEVDTKLFCSITRFQSENAIPVFDLRDNLAENLGEFISRIRR